MKKWKYRNGQTPDFVKEYDGFIQSVNSEGDARSHHTNGYVIDSIATNNPFDLIEEKNKVVVYINLWSEIANPSNIVEFSSRYEKEVEGDILDTDKVEWQLFARKSVVIEEGEGLMDVWQEIDLVNEY